MLVVAIRQQSRRERGGAPGAQGGSFGHPCPNGAGKTALIRMLLGLTQADDGTMSLLGQEVPKHRDVALSRAGAIVDEPRFYGHLTGRQKLEFLTAARAPEAWDPHRIFTRGPGQQVRNRRFAVPPCPGR
ncbi:MAG: ATP-binding cassette domain-containing protein [Acidimicrobiales bacterium]